MSLIRWFMSRALPISVLGGATLYLILVKHSVFGSQREIFIGLLLFIFASLWFRNLVTHPAYVPTLLCFIIGLFFYQSWQQEGPHAQGTVVLGVLLAILILINFSKFLSSPDE